MKLVLCFVLMLTLGAAQTAFVPEFPEGVTGKYNILTPELVKQLGLPFQINWTAINVWVRTTEEDVSVLCVEVGWDGKNTETRCSPTHPKHESLISFQVASGEQIILQKLKITKHVVKP